MGLEFGGKRAPRGESQNFVLFRTIKIKILTKFQSNFVQIERNLRNKMEKQSFQLRSSCTSVQRQRKYEFFGAKYEVRLRNWRF